jgi:hypothetical protein
VLLRTMATSATCLRRRCYGRWWRCCAGCRPMLQRADGAAPSVVHWCYIPLVAFATKVEHRCYFGRAAPLRTLAAGATCRWQRGLVGATIGTMRCYYRREESLQLVAAVLPSKFVGATIGGRSCYHRRASMVPLLAAFAASQI